MGPTTPTARDTRQPVRLGPLLAHYYSRKLTARDVLLLFTPGIAACLAPLGYGLWRAEYAYTRYGPVAAEYWSRPWYYLAIAAAVIFMILGFFRLRLSLISVKVYQKGISVRTGFRRARDFGWEDFHGLTSSTTQEHFFGFPVRSTHQARLILKSGKTIELPRSLRNFPELISRIKVNLYPRLLPQLHSEFQSGAWLSFGPVAIQQQGLRWDGQSASWQQVKRIDVREGKLVIEFTDHANKIIPVSRIPNLELVLQLIDQGIPF
jgi:hypothetical protein